jgi:hypothetical protein
VFSGESENVLSGESENVFSEESENVFSGEQEITNCIVFGLTRLGLNLRIYGTRGDHRASSNYNTVDNIYYYA